MSLLRQVSAVVAIATSSLLLSPAAAPAQAPARLCDPISGIGMGITRTKGLAPSNLFVAGNFHTSPDAPIAAASATERKQLRDLAYVSTIRVQLEGGATRDKNVLNVLLSAGNGCFVAPSAPDTGLPDVLVGDVPTLMAAGTLHDNRDGHAVDEDIAVLDTHFDDFNRSAKLRIFIGDGAGHFAPGTGISVFPLPQDQIPVAMALGRFRGPDMPVDIAVVSKSRRPDAAERSQLTFLRNNGRGEFSIASPPIPLGNFEPAAMLASDRLRRERRYDLVIKEGQNPSGSKRILYLKNAGDGSFPEIAVLNGAGEVDKLLVGPLTTANNDAGELDLITFDRNMTVVTFRNHREGGFNPATRATGQVSNFEFAGDAQFGVVPSDDGSLHLITAARRKSDDRLGALLLKADGPGHLAADFRPLRDLDTGPESTAHISFDSQETIGPGVQPDTPKKTLHISEALVDRFYSVQHGNGKPDLALSAQHVVRETRLGTCSKLRTGQLYNVAFRAFGTHAICLNEIHCGVADDIAPVCAGPVSVTGHCECRCPRDPPPRPPEFCTIIKAFPPMLIAVGNPFNPN